MRLLPLQAMVLAGVLFVFSNLPVDAERITPSSRGERIAERAVELEGLPYRWGGASPEGFDCSGLSWFLYRAEGVDIPRTTSSLVNLPEVEDLTAGDILVFANTYRNGISHVGIYLWDNYFIHAASERYGVIVSSLSNPYWRSHYVGAVRPE